MSVYHQTQWIFVNAFWICDLSYNDMLINGTDNSSMQIKLPDSLLDQCQKPFISIGIDDDM